MIWKVSAAGFFVLLFLIAYFPEKTGAFRAGEIRGYRAGQLDAHNNRWKYEMATKPTGEVVWAEKKE